MSNFTMIAQASKRLKGHSRRTPLLNSAALDEIAGKRVWLKAECLQHTGSFKFRGAWSAISSLSQEQLNNGIIAFSSGNHAQGVSLAAAKHGASAIIVMPSDAPKIKIENTKKLGAEVVLYDRAHESREEVAAKINADGNRTLIRPFDEPLVIAGQGTVGVEIAEQAKENEIQNANVLVCCGGGGLTSGIALALEELAPNFKVHPVEPKEFDDVKRSLEAGEIKSNKKLSGSLCDAIITQQPGDLTFPILSKLCSSGVVVTEEEALRALALAFEHLRIVIEPGGAVALAAALFHPNEFESDDVIAVASGGNVDTDVFIDALKKYKG